MSECKKLLKKNINKHTLIGDLWGQSSHILKPERVVRGRG